MAMTLMSDAANDHRVAMAEVAARACEHKVTVNGAECVGKLRPAFWEDMAWLSM